MIRFRPYPGVTVAALLMTGFLVFLGCWQLQRLTWKENLIATVSGHMLAKPLSLDQALRLGPDDVQYRRVSLAGHFDNAREVFVFTTGAGGDPVYHVLTPFITDDGRTVMLDRGEIPGDLMPAYRRVAVQGHTHVTGVWRVPDAPGFFTPRPAPARRVWYARDLKGIAAAGHVTLAAPVVIEADATPNPGGWPKGGQTVVDFPNNHLSYAMTWFGLAIGLLGVYFAYHISKGRLGLSGKRP